MKHRPTSRRRRSSTRSVLRLLDLEHSKTAVLNSLTSQDAQRGYRHAIDEFVDWYCSEPRLAFNRIVVLRYRSHLESRQLAPGTVNLRLGAVRRLAYEAADCGLLSADLAAGIRRVKGVKKLGVRLGNWLTAEQGQALWQAPDRERLKGKRDRALLALLLVDGGGKRGQNSGGLVTFHSAPFPLGRGCSLRTARSGQGRAGVARRSEPFTARTVLRSSTRGKGVALNGPLKWPSRSPPLTDTKPSH